MSTVRWPLQSKQLMQSFTYTGDNFSVSVQPADPLIPFWKANMTYNNGLWFLFQGAFRWIRLEPWLWYSSLLIHICWNEPKLPRIDPPVVQIKKFKLASMLLSMFWRIGQHLHSGVVGLLLATVCISCKVTGESCVFKEHVVHPLSYDAFRT